MRKHENRYDKKIRICKKRKKKIAQETAKRKDTLPIKQKHDLKNPK